MKRFIAALALAFVVGCTATGGTVGVQTPLEAVYVAEVSLTVAVNALADVHDKGIVTGVNYEKAKAIEKQAHATLLDAKAAARAKDATKADVLVKTVAALIDQIAVYNGGKK